MNEILFYGGIVLFICMFLGALAALILSKIGKIRLNAQLEKEYGDQPKKNKNNI